MNCKVEAMVLSDWQPYDGQRICWLLYAAMLTGPADNPLLARSDPSGADLLHTTSLKKAALA